MNKGGRPATGSIKWRRNATTGVTHWHVRLTLKDGSRPFIPLDPSIPQSDEVRARDGARLVSEKARVSGVIPDSVRETWAQWFARFHDAKEARGLSSVAEMRGRAAKWVLPTIGHKDVRAITREDVEAIVRRLDHAMLAWQEADGERGEGRIAPATAANVWGDLAHALDEAVRAKDASLRVLDSNPAEHVRGPEGGADREGPVLYGNEVHALLTGHAVDDGAHDVPLYRRRVYAFALYTMARRSELAAITVGDVDLETQTITISKQIDRKSKTKRATKKTKTRRTRVIDVEPNVLPLITRLVTEAGKSNKGARLLHLPPPEDCAELLRKDLWTVGARRDALHTSDATRTAMTFHCLRDTGLTHMAVRGDSPIAIQWRAGHTDYKTTEGYVQRGRVEARRIGDPLAPLPVEVLKAGAPSFGSVLPPSETRRPSVRELLAILRPQWGLKIEQENASMRENQADSRTLARGAKAETVDASKAFVWSTTESNGNDAEPDDVEIERGIAEAIMQGREDLAHDLAERLRERRVTT